MIVGVPKETKDNEYRVGLVPSTVRELVAEGGLQRLDIHPGSGGRCGCGSP